MRNGAEPRIIRIQPLRPRGLRVLVHLDNDGEEDEPLEVMLEALERCRLGVGDPLPPQARHHLLNEDASTRASTVWKRRA